MAVFSRPASPRILPDFDERAGWDGTVKSICYNRNYRVISQESVNALGVVLDSVRHWIDRARLVYVVWGR
jgi:hypothetical protein